MYYFFGAGQNCYGALAFFGKDKVKAVIDNSLARQGTEILGVPIISFDEFLKKKKDETVIITTIACSQEIIEQLKRYAIYNFFVCPYMQSGFYKCDEIIQLFNLVQYHSFAIYGKNPVSEHLMDEIAKKMGYECEKYFISEAEWKKGEQISTDVLLIVKENAEIQNGNRTRFNNIINLYEAIKERKHSEYKCLKKYHNYHFGESCFLIGNGPSLKTDDLDRIGKEGILSFGCNRIFKIFDKTDWRPDYYVVIDSMMYETKPKNLDDTVFFVRDFIEGVDKKENVNYLNCKIETYYPGYPKFSDDLTEGIYSGTTVLYAMFQIAVYMGFKKIYLLGVDFSWGEDGKDTHFCKGYMNDQLVKDAMIHKEAQRNAYISVKKYAEEHNIEVLNATRGGYLNVFERIEFEELFNKAGKITDDIRRE